MGDNISFKLSGMEDTREEAQNLTNKFGAVMNELNNSVVGLGQVWTSDETGTYETFKQKYDEKKKVLDEAKATMQSFCNKLEEKQGDFQSAAKTINNAAE